MKITVTINKVNYDVEVHAQPHEICPSEITIGGQRVPIDLQPERWLREFPRSLKIRETPHEILFDYGDDGFPNQVWIDGKPSHVEVEFQGKGNLAKKKGVGLTQIAAGNAIAAPMPGKIIAVKVKEGQEVEQGQLCVVLEAMKMENELAAPRAGKIKKVLAEQGANVDLDQVLVTLEE